jgi:phosphotransacetylase
MNPMIERIRTRAKQNPKKYISPKNNDERVLEAIKYIEKRAHRYTNSSYAR